MTNVEKNISAQRRKKRSESEGDLNISHWRGDLHAHTRTDLSNPETPEEIVERRRGSNCGVVPLGALVRYHAQEMRNEFIAITDHSRDGDPEAALEGITKWFRGMYLKNEDWLRENFQKTKQELSGEDIEQIEAKARSNAEQLALYGDERLEDVFQEIDSLLGQEGVPIRVFKGIEANLLPDGSFDTEMIDRGEFELVNCSIHPAVDSKGFAPIVEDSDKYSDLTIKGIEHPKTNIICHMGFGCDREFIDELQWAKIAEAAIENNVAIEVNIKPVIDCIYKEMLDYGKYPKNDIGYRDVFRKRLPALVPILSSEKIKKVLGPYFERGLRIAINTDEHKAKFIKTEVTKDGATEEFIKRDIRLWRCLKIVEEYFNGLFSELGINAENIINTYPQERLEQFMNKTA
ncbi:MAG: hypothetical protein ABID45_04440 [Patescibacteria group bacterium]